MSNARTYTQRREIMEPTVDKIHNKFEQQNRIIIIIVVIMRSLLSSKVTFEQKALRV